MEQKSKLVAETSQMSLLSSQGLNSTKAPKKVVGVAPLPEVTISDDDYAELVESSPVPQGVDAATAKLH